MTLAIAAFLASTRTLRCRCLVSAKRRLSVCVPASARALTTRLQPMRRKKRKKRKGPRKTRTKKTNGRHTRNNSGEETRTSARMRTPLPKCTRVCMLHSKAYARNRVCASARSHVCSRMGSPARLARRNTRRESGGKSARTRARKTTPLPKLTLMFVTEYVARCALCLCLDSRQALVRVCPRVELPPQPGRKGRNARTRKRAPLPICADFCI